MSEVEFEIVEKPSAGKPGLMRIKQEKPAAERLADLVKERLLDGFPGKTLEQIAEIQDPYFGSHPRMAAILLELEAEKTKGQGTNMTVKELIDKLMSMPQDANVHLDPDGREWCIATKVSCLDMADGSKEVWIE